MNRPLRWIVVLLAIALVALAALAAGIAWWLPPKDELRQQLAERATAAAGLPVTVGALDWQLLPTPRIVLRDLATVQPQPLMIGQITLWPQWRGLLQRTVAFSRIEVRGGQVPTLSLRAFRDRAMPAGADADAGAGAGWKLAASPVQTLAVERLLWIDRRGIVLPFSGEIRFDADGMPRSAHVERAPDQPATDRAVGAPDKKDAVAPADRADAMQKPDAAAAARAGAEPATADIARQGDANAWSADIAIGGGRLRGEFTLESTAGKRLLLKGTLDPKGVEVAALLATLKRESSVSGTYRGSTYLRAEGAKLTDLPRALHTSTRFTMQPALLDGFDLERAVRSAGTTTGGQTRLDSFSGRIETQNSDDGMRFTYTGLRATSGVLTATGSATIQNRRVDGNVAVDLVDGVVGLPLRITGTVGAPQLALSGGAAVGAAVGTALAPGVGTLLGARIGDRLGKVFGGGKPDRKKSPSNRPAQPTPAGPRAP